MKQIKLFVMDVDGTMTDGKIYMGENGELFKAFCIKDGYGVHELLPNNGIKTAIMTGRESYIVDNRARELEIDYVLQGIKDKAMELHKLAKKVDVTFEEIAYIGDDEIDIPAIQISGVSACPHDASGSVKRIVDYVCVNCAGNGAVREFAEYIVSRNNEMKEGK